MKIAITGADGFLGKHLAQFLKNDFQIALFDRKKHDLFDTKSLESFLKDASVLIHLAGANRDSDYNLFRNNTIATAALLDAVRVYCPKSKIIFSSSFQAYEQSAYGVSKKLAEDIIKSFSKFYRIKSIIFRISNIYGPGGRPFYNSVIATFYDLIKNGKTIVINGTGEQKRDYIYVSDVTAAIKKAINYNEKTSETFDICSGELISLNEVVEIIRNILPDKFSVEYKSGDALQREELQRNYKKAESELLWKPQVSLQQGIKNIFKE